jgi:hypothetical protein
MKKILRNVLIMLASLVAVAACKKEEAAKPVAAPVVLTVPADPADLEGWKKYLGATVKANMEGIRQRPYMYFVPLVVDEETQRQYEAQTTNVEDTLARGVLPGNMIAFGSPDSAKLADLVIQAFKLAGDGSLKGVRVLFIGARADEQRVRDAVAPSSGDFVFVEAK